MQLSTSSCNPACQERRSITHALLRAAVPMRFVTAGCKPAKQERRTKSINVRAALTLGLRPHKSGAAPNPCFFYVFYVKSSSRYSLVHILQASSSKSVPRPSVY